MLYPQPSRNTFVRLDKTPFSFCSYHDMHSLSTSRRTYTYKAVFASHFCALRDSN